MMVRRAAIEQLLIVRGDGKLLGCCCDGATVTSAGKQRRSGPLTATEKSAMSMRGTFYQGPLFKAWGTSPELPRAGAGGSAKPLRSETPAESPPKLLCPSEADTRGSATWTPGVRRRSKADMSDQRKAD